MDQHNSYIPTVAGGVFKLPQNEGAMDPAANSLSPIRKVQGAGLAEPYRFMNKPRANSPNSLLPLAQRAPLTPT